MSQIQVLDLRFRSQVLENDLELGPKACKWSQNQDLTPRKGPRFSSSQVQDLGHRSQNMPQIWFLGPRFRSQVQENVLNLGPISWDYVLGTGTFPRIRLYVLENVLGLISRFSERSQIQGHYPHIFLLGPSKAPRFRSQVLEKFLDLGRLS